jgi:hypothetical protein
LFDDLAVVVIYHFCDVRYKQRAEQAARRLTCLKIINGLDDAETAYQKYEDAVVTYAKEHLPTNYDVRYDYYGAKVITNDHGWKAPKIGLYAGDSPGRIMLFDNFVALQEYTEEKIKELENED